MKKLIIAFALCFSLLTITGCEFLMGKELGQVNINILSETKDSFLEQEFSVQLEKGKEYYFWSDIDIEYNGSKEIKFKAVLQKNNTTIEEFDINPFKKDITINESTWSIDNRGSIRFSGRNNKFIAKESGKYTVKSIINPINSKKIKINKAKLSIRD